MFGRASGQTPKIASEVTAIDVPLAPDEVMMSCVFYAARETPNRLTRRVDGRSSKEIAGQLNLSYRTIEAHRARIMKKMKSDSVAHLVQMVVSTNALAD